MLDNQGLWFYNHLARTLRPGKNPLQGIEL